MSDQTITSADVGTLNPTPTADSGHAPQERKIVDAPTEDGRAIDKPYLWRALLRDGTVMVRGDAHKGKTVLSPIHLPQEELVRLDLLPAIEGAKWPAMSVTLITGSTLEYALTREERFAIGVDARLIGSEYVAARLGYKTADGMKKLLWGFADGRLVEFGGTYEEGLNTKAFGGRP